MSIKLLKLVGEHELKQPLTEFENCISVLVKYSSFKGDDAKVFDTSFQALVATCGIPVSNSALESEKVPRLKTVTLTAGHWYQCKNHHIYSEAGISEVSCPECTRVSNRTTSAAPKSKCIDNNDKRIQGVMEEHVNETQSI